MFEGHDPFLGHLHCLREHLKWEHEGFGRVVGVFYRHISNLGMFCKGMIEYSSVLSALRSIL